MKNKLFGLICLTALLPGLSIAQSEDAAISIGESSLIPSVRITYNSTDNAFRQEFDQVDETSFSVAPALRWEADKRSLNVFGDYQGDYLSSSEEALDFAHHTLSLGLSADLSAKNRFQALFRIDDGTEEFDEGFSRFSISDQLSELVRFRDTGLLLTYRFGARNAKGNIGVNLRLLSRTYLNQETLTEGGDYSFVVPSVIFSYRVLGDTRAFVELRQSSTDYDSAFLDRSATALLVGMNFGDDGKLSGSLAIGAVSTDFDNGTDESTVILENSLVYEVTRYSVFSLDLRREIDNNDGLNAVAGASIKTDSTLKWQHEWNSRFSTEAQAKYTSNERTCSNPDNQVALLGVEAVYKFRRWMSFGLGVDTQSNSVDQCSENQDGEQLSEDQDYTRNSVSVFFRASL